MDDVHLHTAVQAVARDESIPCTCNSVDHHDGLCPRCTCKLALDEERASFGKSGRYETMSLEELSRQVFIWHLQEERIKTLAIFVKHMGLAAENAIQKYLSRSQDMRTKTFGLTQDHLKLLARANVIWEDSEFGAPAIDPKRPFGNSDVPGDIAEILGWPVPHDESDAYELFQDRCTEIMEELVTALRIVLVAQSFVPGTYTKTGEYNDASWKLT